MFSLPIHRLSRRAAVVTGSVGVALVAACADTATAPPGNAPTAPSSLPTGANAGMFSGISPVVDGVMSPGEYNGAATISFRAMLPPNAQGSGTPVTVYITHDKTYLYLATVFDRKSAFHPADGVFFEFDKDNDGLREDGDETLGVSAWGPGAPMPFPGMDLHRRTVNNVSANAFDTSEGGTNNAISAWGAVGTTGVFEIRQELNSMDDPRDLSIDFSNGAKTVGIMTQVQLEADPIGSGQNVNTFKPSFFTYCKLTLGKKVTSVSCP